MHTLHLSHSINPSDGGIAVAVHSLIAAQTAAGQSSHWLTGDTFPPLLRDFQLRQSVLNEQPSLLHLHGLWRSHTRIASALSDSGLPLVVSLHGMLNPIAIAHSGWKKKLVWSLWERRALLSSCCLHALSTSEAATIRALLPQASIAVIPNGVEIPAEEVGLMTSAPWDSTIPSGSKVLLFLSRFHSGKGIKPLLSAWQAMLSEAEHRGWWLAIVGYGDNNALKYQLNRFPIPRCQVFGPVFGPDKKAALRSASAFVLPSHFEALPMAALEAMAYRLPCLLSDACNLPEAFSLGAAISAEPNPDALTKSLSKIFALSQADRETMGSAGYDLVASRYSWCDIAEKTLGLYNWILEGGDIPGFVEMG